MHILLSRYRNHGILEYWNGDILLKSIFPSFQVSKGVLSTKLLYMIIQPSWNIVFEQMFIFIKNEIGLSLELKNIENCNIINIFQDLI
jgi:hypothetical protein